jgi:tellurite resistance protein
MEFFPEIDISQAQAEAMARGMYAVARSDGAVHPRESALLADFFADAIDGRAPDMAQLERDPDITPAQLALTLIGIDHRKLFVKSCVLLAYADGSFGGQEAEKVAEYAGALGIDNQTLRALEEQVKDYLIGHLSGLANSEAVAEVSSGMNRK